jgi:pyrimidine-nucleoside phosphorylase
MMAARVIAKKRDGEPLSAAEIGQFFGAYSRGEVAEYQMAAFLMAVCFRGMQPEELAALVEAILESGITVDLSSIPGKKVDKHSTGGVGDKVSLVLAPLVASLGVPVPMMSGRGLGHSGGTVDKLESIPGFRTDLTVAEYRSQLERIGCALISQTAEVAPLDRRLYALRDVTATVESIPLIASSIMSKKLAEGIDALLLDVKLGNGAFLPEPERAELLAWTMIGIGRTHGKDVVALLTAMDRPLGFAIGNALEVAESIEVLRGGGPPDLRELTLVQAAEMLLLGGAAPDAERARAAAESALADGRAAARFQDIIEAQGGDPAVVDDPAILPVAPVELTVRAAADGWVGAMDVRAIGLASVALGAGRLTLDAAIDPAVGFHVTAKPGDRVEVGGLLARVHVRNEAAGQRAVAQLDRAIPVVPAPPAPALPLLVSRLQG